MTTSPPFVYRIEVIKTGGLIGLGKAASKQLWKFLGELQFRQTEHPRCYGAGRISRRDVIT